MTRRHGDTETRRGRSHAALLLLAILIASRCSFGSDVRIARRILEGHRRKARVKPLPFSQVIRLKITLPGRTEAQGTAEIEWDSLRYRESLSSAGLTTIRGIQGGKAYFTDEDGVTRVASEPVLAELLTRSYFWRRAYLFEDLQRARIGLGPADESSLSVKITPRGGNALLLTFSRRDSRLLSARSPRFDLAFETPSRFRDASRRDSPIEAEVRWIGLPTGRMQDTEVGGWSARWSGKFAETPFQRAGQAVTVPGRISGLDARIAIDAAADGPLRVRSRLAKKLGFPFQPDVFGRVVAKGGTFEIGTLFFPSLSLEKSDSVPDGADAIVGAALFRETVVELDPAAARVRFYDPARWVSPEGFSRVVIDDDGNRPVAILRKGGQPLRLLAGTTSDAAIVLASQSASRAGLSASDAGTEGLRWGAVRLPRLPMRVATAGFDPEWGEDGSLGYDLLLRFHLFVDMPHRWVYLRPL